MLLLSWGGTLTVGDESLASQLGTLEITDDSPVINLSVDTRATVAFAERYQRLGVRVEYDRGDGVFLTFPAHTDLADTLVIEESADRFGDTLSFAVTGEKWAPFARQVLRARTEIRVYFITGSPQHEFSARVFTGWIVTSRYDVTPPVTHIEALDAAGMHAEKRAKDWSLPPHSGRTRREITLELLTIGAIPYGALDFGPDGGGVVNKPHTLGDRPIVAWLQDALAVKGVEVGFEGGVFVARRYDATLPPVLELTPANLFPEIGLTPPATLAPNVLGVVAVEVTRSDLGGYVTEQPVSVVVTGPYAPDTAVEVIEGGVVTATGLTPIEAVQKISESLTTVTKFGGVAVRTEKLERGWFAEAAAGAQVERVGSSPSSPGVWEYTVDPVTGTVWVYPDGSTRNVPRETYRELSRTINTKTMDDQYRVIGEREERYKWQIFRRAIFEVDFLSSVLVDEPPGGSGDPVPIGDDGQGMMYGREVYGGLLFGLPHPNELVEKSYTLNADGEIVTEVTTEYFHQLPPTIRRRDNAHGFGLDNRTYHSAGDEGIESNFSHVLPWRGLRVTTKTYESIDEDSYRVIESVRLGSKAPTVTTSDPIIGSLPRPEQASPVSSSQEIRSMYEDRERIAMAGGEEIEDVEHNEFIETQAEADAYARHRARKASAIILSGTMPIEGLAHKWRMVRVKVPGAAIDGLSFEVRTVRRDAASFSQSITAAYYAPGI